MQQSTLSKYKTFRSAKRGIVERKIYHYHCCTMRSFALKKLRFILLAFLLSAGVPLMAQEGFDSLRDQFMQIRSFEQVQNPSLKEPDATTILAGNFFDSQHNQEEFDELTAEVWSGFFELNFERDNDENFSRRLEILSAEGRRQSAALPPECVDHEQTPFTSHVKEAIEVNQARQKYYAGISRGATSKVSLFYTSLEYSLLPLTVFFDRWAQKFRKAGMPVLTDDFVSMSGISSPDKPLLRRGVLDRAGHRDLRKMLRAWQWKSGLAASRKDFLKVQLLAMNALHELRQMELRYQCNLSLTIHFVESVGLAARNADRLSHQYAKRTDNFYRAFIAIQISGVRLFSKIDLQAQPFHRAGIGIIVNDLPAIPFP